MSAVLPQDMSLAITGRIVSPDKSMFVLAETKRSQTIDEASANAQGMAQLLTAEYDDS